MAMIKIHPEGLTALKFGAVGCVGFLIDISVFRLMLHLGLSALAARAISLALAMQATFLINGLVVFRCLRANRWLGQWLAYMGTNGVGNLCNYGVFAGLVLSRLPFLSHHGTALLIGSLTAYSVNYLSARLLVFGKPQGQDGRPACEAPAAAGKAAALQSAQF
jgi:putative flippase GtrA